MLRNDYRRALIMFRPLEQGYSGHARLERRTLMGTLCLTASAPGAAALRAALVGRRGNDYFAAPLGAMRRDSRGQYSLIASFDPRNIEGRELEDYQLLVVVDAGDPCRLVLSGNVCGSVQMDWERVRREACALFTPGANAREAADAPDAANGEGEAVLGRMRPPRKLRRARRTKAPLHGKTRPPRKFLRRRPPRRTGQARPPSSPRRMRAVAGRPFCRRAGRGSGVGRFTAMAKGL